jgi:hypothetical protein
MERLGVSDVHAGSWTSSQTRESAAPGQEVLDEVDDGNHPRRYLYAEKR